MGVKVGGSDSLIKKLKALGNKATDALKQGIMAGCLLVERDAKLNVKSNTGALRESITHQVFVSDKEVKGVIGSNFKYAPFIEFGTGPIGAAAKPAIAEKLNITYTNEPWVYYSDSKEQFFTTSGQPGVPYLYPALENNKEEIKEMIARAVERVFKEMGGKNGK